MDQNEKAQNELLKRVEKMEPILNRATDLMDRLDVVLDELEEQKNEVAQLFMYYTGNDWLDDMHMVDDGFTPEISHGVLSQDSVYNLMIRYRAIAERMISMGNDLLDGED